MEAARKGRRAAAERSGRRAETLAALWLQLKGYRLLARRFRSHGGEIDLVMRKGRLVAFVEVKARGDVDAAIFAVAPKTRRRIEQAGRAFLARTRGLEDCAVRYDIAAIAGWRVRHLADAWRADPPR